VLAIIDMAVVQNFLMLYLENDHYSALLPPTEELHFLLYISGSNKLQRSKNLVEARAKRNGRIK
jgi:hypothetical protein